MATGPNYGFVGEIPLIGANGSTAILANIETNVQEALAYRNSHSVGETVQWLFQRFRNNRDQHAPQE